MLGINKHDSHVAELVEKVSHNYDAVITHYPILSKRKRRVAEADIIGITDGRIDVFEVKCSHRPAKATQQLRKLKRLLAIDFDDKVIHTFFYCGCSRRLQIVT